MPMIKLVPKTREEALADLATMAPEDRAEVSTAWIERLNDPAGVAPWILGFRIVVSETEVVVGGCGFKGAPDETRTDEIGYGIDAEHRGKGYATEAAQALVEYAVRSGEVATVIAHTLPENNASARVLTKCGFRNVGEVVDPEDGLVRRWERTLT
jgi:RimJ/RimL family protein N-acetyltransferase